MNWKPKQKKCKQCTNKFMPYNPLQATCSIACALEYNRVQAAKKEAKEWKEKRKKLVEKLKTLGQYEAEAKREFQKFIRLRDKDLPCISCGVHQSNLWDGGHLFKAEIYSGVIFNEFNVNKQCGKCNRYLGGNELNYREGLIKKIGIENFKILEDLKDKTRNRKYTKEELINIKNYYFRQNKLMLNQ